jgi:deazaflavin-dependent oxidoreductase (nitroreductase family)
MGGWPTRAELRAINARLVEQFLGQEPQPLVEGGHAVRILESHGRRTGQSRRTPVGVTQVDGRHYLISPDPTRDWVRNLVAEPRCALVGAGGPRLAIPAGGDEAVTAIATYLSGLQNPFALQAFPVAPDASPEEIAGHVDSIAVFRLDDR